MKRNKRDIVFIGLIILATIFAWHGVLNQTIEGEGFYYFSPTNSLVLPNGKLADLIHGYDNFPKIAYFILQIFFGGNIQPYMTTLLGTIILVNICFYMFVKKITDNSHIALLSSIYAGVYYTGNFQFYARGHFQWFVQRVPELIPIFVSFSFLIKFASSKKTKHYFLSLAFFTLALFMTHYATFFLPFFPAFMIVASIFKIKNKGEKIKIIALSVPFIVINYLVTKNASLNLSTIHPNQTLLQSLIQIEDIIPKISYQLVVVTVPFSILQFLKEQLNQNWQELIFSLIVPTYLFYLIMFRCLHKQRSRAFEFALTSFIALLGALFLNVYLNRTKIYNEIEQGRYFYIPALYVGTIWASFLANATKRFRTIAIVLFIIAWTGINTRLIWKKIHDSQYIFTGGKALLYHLDNIKSQLPESAIVILPNPVMPLGEDFLRKYYSGQNTRFLYLDAKWQSRIPENFNPNKLFVFTYNEEIKKGGNADLDKITIVDKSEEYREILLVPRK